jgi:hypothetical protein
MIQRSSFDPTQTVAEPINDLEYMQDLRSRVLAGEHVSSEEYSRVLESLRRSRTAAPAVKPRTSRAKSTKPALPATEATAAADALFAFD